ncbi:MAG TPA: hypothetical protein VE093_02895 [Polyangiaceae bacterium]|jgi:hypothetical protein|nr:hypothetical protein [Polyangiaceae bacterium]
MISAIGAAAMILSVPLVSMASYEEPNYGDVTYACNNITAELTQILAIATVKAGDVKIVYIEDILTGSELVNVKNTLNKLTVQLEILTLRNSLNNIKILNGANILTFNQFLSNNNVNASDVVAINAFENGGLLVFGCKTCK